MMKHVLVQRTSLTYFNVTAHMVVQFVRRRLISNEGCMLEALNGDLSSPPLLCFICWLVGYA